MFESQTIQLMYQALWLVLLLSAPTKGTINTIVPLLQLVHDSRASAPQPQDQEQQRLHLAVLSSVSALPANSTAFAGKDR